MNRCLNDIFAYCQGKPKPKESTEIKTAFDYKGNTNQWIIPIIICKLNPLTCPKYVTFSQILAPSP